MTADQGKALKAPQHSPDRVPQRVLDDLRRRLRATRLVPVTESAGWQRGTDPAYLAGLVEHWAEDYDWREHEQRVLALPWIVTGSTDRCLRLLHQRSARTDAPAVLLLHGWPDSVLRFTRALPLLTDMHTVVPALPGFPFGATPTPPGMSVAVMAEFVAEAMRALGYDHYVVSGGDIGGDVAEQLAAAHPDRVAALHLPNVSPRRLPLLDPASLTTVEQDYVQRAQQFQMTEGGYLLQQRTKPNTLTPGLGDSPAGLAAWLVEKYRSWSDCHDDLESAFPRADLLTWITAYWVTESIGTSFSAYTNPSPPPPYVDVPTYFSLSPRDIVPAPRAVAERSYNVASWHENASGGHFAAWEDPGTYSDALRQVAAHL